MFKIHLKCEERKRKYAVIEDQDEISSELEKRPVKIRKVDFIANTT